MHLTHAHAVKLTSVEFIFNVASGSDDNAAEQTAARIHPRDVRQLQTMHVATVQTWQLEDLKHIHTIAVETSPTPPAQNSDDKMT
jgi:hypothetical protein